MAGADAERLRQRLSEIGGTRQQAAARETSVPQRNALASRLLPLMGWGDLSANQMQWICEGAVLDGHAHVDVHHLSRAGTTGKHRGNIRRDMLSRFLKRKNVVPKPLVVPTLMKNAEDNVVDGTLHLISPVHTADHLFNTKKSVFTAMWGSAEKKTVIILIS